MNNFEVKNMVFYGDVVRVAKDQNEVIWVGMRSLMKALGLKREGQLQNVYQKAHMDPVLRANKITMEASDTSKYKLSYIALDYLPMWLSRIKPDNDRIAEKLATFQVVFRGEVLKQFPSARGLGVYKKKLVQIEDRISRIQENFDKLEKLVNARLETEKADVREEIFDSTKAVDKIIEPLAKKRKDKSRGFCSTYAMLYKYMVDRYGINWYPFYREYEEKNGVYPRSKKELVNNTPVLLEKFESVVNDLVAVA